MSPDSNTTTAVAVTAKPSLNLPANTAPGLFSPTGTIFSSDERFNAAMRVAGVLAKSTIVPARYHGKEADVLVALDFASIVGVPALMVMQNLFVIEGKPTWAATFVIAAIRGCGRFTDVQFKHGVDGKVKTVTLGEIENRTCFLQAVDVRTNELVVGTTISYAMAVAEGWFDKRGSKWPYMGEQMLQYRSGSFFGRLHIADILLGMHDADEVSDAGAAPLPATGLPDAGTEAVLVPQANRRTVTPRAAPVAPVVPVMTASSTPAVGETQMGEYVESTPVEDVPAPVLSALADDVASVPSHAVNAPVATPAPAPAAAPVQGAPVYVFQASQQHFDTLVKVTQNPLGKALTDDERKLVKEFGAAHPEFITLPKRIDANIIITEAGLVWMRANATAFGYGLNGTEAPAEDAQQPASEASQGAPAADTRTPDEVAVAVTAQLAGTPAETPEALAGAIASNMADMPLQATATGGTVAAAPVAPLVSHNDPATWPEGFYFITEGGDEETPENRDKDEAAHVRAKRFREQLLYFYKHERPDLAPVAAPTQAELNQQQRDATQQQQYGGAGDATQKDAGAKGFF